MKRTIHLLCFAMLATAGLAQRSKSSKRDKWKFDKYTKQEPEAMKQAGYLSFGPFPWGDDHSTDVIEKKMDLRIRWVETEHFRIGSALPAFTVRPKDKKDKKYVKSLRAELVELEKRLPYLKAKRIKSKIDPWLRVHLFAMRLEKLYEDVAERLAKSKATKPKVAPASAPGKWNFDGLPPKFCVLMFHRKTSMEAYIARFLDGRNKKFPRRYIFPKSQNPIFVTAAQFGNLGNDGALTNNVIFSTVHNLIDIYNGNFYVVPVWWREGVAHWFARRVHRDWHNYSQPPSEKGGEMRRFEDWAVIVRNLVKNDNFTPSETMMDWLTFGKIKLKDHFVAWSRIDYLMQANESGFGTFMDGIKGLRDARGATIRGKAVLDYQKKALETAWGLTPATLDEKWRKWVMEKYPKK